MSTPERTTAKAFYQWLSLQYPIEASHLIKIDNEGKRKVIEKNGKKIPIGVISAIQQGLQPKASDYFLAWPSEHYHGLFAEFKPDGWKGPKGKKEKEHVNGQNEFLLKMQAAGFAASFAIGIDEAMKLFIRYLTNQRIECTSAYLTK